MSLDLVEGQTRGVEYELAEDNIPVSLASATVELVLKNREGTVIDTVGDVTVVDESGGKVKYAPDAADLTAAKSPYQVRWKVTKSGEISYYPNGEWERWTVRKP